MDAVRLLRRGEQGRAAAGARAEEADLEIAQLGHAFRPAAQRHQSIRQHADIEAKPSASLIELFFFLRQQIDQQCRETLLVERVGDVAISRAEAAAAAPVREHDEPARLLRHRELAGEGVWSRAVASALASTTSSRSGSSIRAMPVS